MTFGERLKALREKRGWTQKKLAQLSGLTQDWVCRFETGERLPSFERLVGLRKALGVSWNMLLGKP